MKGKKETSEGITLKGFHKKTSRHVLVLEADIKEQDTYALLHLSNLIRIAGNDLIAVMKKKYEQLRRTKRYRSLLKLYRKAKESKDEEKRKDIGQQLAQMQKDYGVTWNVCREAMIAINKRYHIPSIFALSKAEDVWSAIQKCLYSDGKTFYFKKYGEYPELRAKQNNRGLILSFDGNDLQFKIGNIQFGVYVNKPKHTRTRTGKEVPVTKAHDRFAEEEVQAIGRYLLSPKEIDASALSLYNQSGVIIDTYRPCFASIVFQCIRGKMRVYVHITVEGQPKTKYNKDGTKRHSYGKGAVGCDIGTQTIAYTSHTEAGLKNLAERGRSISDRERRERLLLRKMDRSRRATNPENYNEDGTIRKGKKNWYKSNRYKKLQQQHKNLSRICAANRQYSINEDVNHIRSLGDTFITEPKNAKKLQHRAKKTTVNKQGRYNRKKRFGRSILNRCPGYFQAQVQQTFERTGGIYIEVPKDYRASQYDHTNMQYVKKKLSQRMYPLSNGTRVQRDWYSSFLLYCMDEKSFKIDQDKCKKDFPVMYQKYLSLEAEIKADHIKVMNSGIRLETA